LKKVTKLLLNKAIDSLVLAIELFNRPYDRAREDSVLILLDHSFEMFLKSSIIHRGGKIYDKKTKQTIVFSSCIGKALSDGAIRFLTEDQAITLNIIHGLRDATQHYYLDVSEQQLYINVQSGVTLFKDLLKKVFNRDLYVDLPERVLPISTTIPVDLLTLFEQDVSEIKRLLAPKSRHHMEAAAKLRSLMIIENTIHGETEQPTDSKIRELMKKSSLDLNWTQIFPGVASMNVNVEGDGPKISIRLTKKEVGIPTTFVPEGTPGASIIAVKKVNELDYYSLQHTLLATKVGISSNQLVALRRYLGIEDDPQYFKVITIGKSRHPLYSKKAFELIKKTFQSESIDEIWSKYRKSITLKRKKTPTIKNVNSHN